MQIKLSELRKLVREGIRLVKEDYAVDANDEIDLEDPTIIWNNTYDMDDQETMTRVANQTINLNPVDDEDNDEVDLAMKSLLMPGVAEAKKSKVGADNFGNSYAWSIAKYAKDQDSEQRKNANRKK